LRLVSGKREGKRTDDSMIQATIVCTAVDVEFRQQAKVERLSAQRFE
jgi:hypothetical protein